VPTFFTSDSHFGDHRTMNIGARAFALVAEMDAALVAGWNDVVGAEDEVWHLGDFARSPDRVPGLLARLHGRKHLVRGNNDPPRTLAAGDWSTVCDYRELQLDGRLLVLCHYPFRSWNGQGRRSINLHGHSHGRLKPMPRQFDVGVDVWNYQPVDLPTILAGPKASAASSHAAFG